MRARVLSCVHAPASCGPHHATLATDPLDAKQIEQHNLFVELTMSSTAVVCAGPAPRCRPINPCASPLCPSVSCVPVDLHADVFLSCERCYGDAERQCFYAYGTCTWMQSSLSCTVARLMICSRCSIRSGTEQSCRVHVSTGYGINVIT